MRDFFLIIYLVCFYRHVVTSILYSFSYFQHLAIDFSNKLKIYPPAAAAAVPTVPRRLLAVLFFCHWYTNRVHLDIKLLIYLQFHLHVLALELALSLAIATALALLLALLLALAFSIPFAIALELALAHALLYLLLHFHLHWHCT